MPHVVSIVYTPRGVGHRKPRGNYARVPADAVTLVERKGIAGDVKGGTGKRQLNVMAAEVVEQLGREGFKTGPGELGEQIVIAGVAPADLSPGARIRLGDAVIEVTIPRTGCERFETIQGRPRTIVEGRLGVLARVVAGGEVRVGGPVAVLPPSPTDETR